MRSTDLIMYENGKGVEKDTEKALGSTGLRGNGSMQAQAALVKSTNSGKASRLITKKRRMLSPGYRAG